MLHSNLLYKMGQDFLDIQYTEMMNRIYFQVVAAAAATGRLMEI